ncbi:NADP-dependent oxidoreductase domain-containing protein [Pholiota molesta]|nr:NADP-dependent oxidoreductase domain-containing protein [Pholiota molesta]
MSQPKKMPDGGVHFLNLPPDDTDVGCLLSFQVRLGSSGVKVSKIILGCMSYGSPEWQSWVLEEEESIKHIKAAYDAGINTFDTANVYSNGQSESILGKAIKQLGLPRDEIVVMTKVQGVVGRWPGHFPWAPGVDLDELGFVNQWGLSRKKVVDLLHQFSISLTAFRRLQCHRFDSNTPIEGTMQALHDVVKAGYIRYIGMSSCWAWQCNPCNAEDDDLDYAINNKLTPFISMQNHYNVVYCEEKREMFPTLNHFGVGSIPWSPLARGLVTRPLGSKDDAGRGKVDRWAIEFLL